jgi:hypothetical protein
MRSVRVFYRCEPDGTWIATSPDVAGYVGYGDSYEEARDRIRDGLPRILCPGKLCHQVLRALSFASTLRAGAPGAWRLATEHFRNVRLALRALLPLRCPVDRSLDGSDDDPV